jgi:uncharacterized protein
MTPEERQMLAGLFQRINANGSAPRDAEAESFINDAVREAPFAPYVLAQTTIVQQHALEAAAHRIAELEAAAHEAAEQRQQPGSFLGNLGKSIFGGGAPSAPPRPDPNAYQGGPAPQQGYAPAPQQNYAPPPPPQYATPRPGPWGGGGGGFLQNAASTAAGVAGGVALGNLLGGLFGGHSGGGLFGGGGFGGAGFPGGGVPTETINNYYEAPPDGSDQFQPNAPDDAGYIDDASFDNGSSDDGSSFDDGSGGGGFEDV